MTARNILMSAAGAAGGAKNYIEDVFSTYLYTGNGSTQTITNGIDLAGEGGLIWTKSRAETGNNWFVDTARGINFGLYSNSTGAQFSDPGTFTSFNSTGYSMNNSYGDLNSGQPGRTYVSWTFREQPKFFDVVTYTGTGSARTVAHNLGSVPGCIIIKRLETTGNWMVYHRSNGPTKGIFLNDASAAFAFSGYWNDTDPTSSVFTVGTSNDVNGPGSPYVAYLFAHDAGGFGLTGTDNVISCGSYTGNGSTSGPVITLGYEPQWLLVKNASATWGWVLVDNMRGLPVGGTSRVLNPNTSDAEGGLNSFNVSATGFSPNSSGVFTNTNGNTYIYIAIRRGPMEVPTVGTSVFAPALGTSASTIPTFVTNFPVDLGFYHSRANTADWFLSSRLQGGGTLNTNTTFAEAVPDANYAFDSNTGWGKNFNSDKASSNFRRAPGFFDEVCYTGTGVARTVAHNLAAVPELMIVKTRSAANAWAVYAQPLGNTGLAYLNWNFAAATGQTLWDSTTPTASTFSVNATATVVNQSGTTYVAYLFATCPGVSKVGSYTGTGTTQTINCGFTAGSRFVLIKRTDSTGDWYVWDSARGIVAGNDPYLLLNSTAAEVTSTDYIDTTSVGFEITSTAPAAINANGGTFIFLAIA